MFVDLEGADGVGKTTLARILEVLLGSITYVTPPKSFKEAHGKLPHDVSPDERYEYFRASIHWASREIAALLAAGEIVVADRYYLSTLASQRFLGATVSADDFQRAVQPDLMVMLTASDDIQRERIVQRGLSDWDRQTLDRQPELKRFYADEARGLNIPYITLDTGILSPIQCGEVVAAWINALS